MVPPGFAALGVLVAVRLFFSWSIVLEIGHRSA
jgi:hypothetical protein